MPFWNWTGALLKAGDVDAGGAVVEEEVVTAVVGCAGDPGVEGSTVDSEAEGGISVEVVCTGGGTTTEVVCDDGGTSTEVVCTGGGTTMGVVGRVHSSVQVETEVTVIVLVWVTGCV